MKKNNKRQRGLRILVVLTGCVMANSFLLPSSFSNTLTADQWREDVDVLVQKIRRYHPQPWNRISESEFLRGSEAIKTNLRMWSNERIIVELMRLTAALRDGHTEVLPDNQEGFNRWFPVRIEKWDDGLFITAADRMHDGLLGAKVLKIGKDDPEKACRRLAEIISADSQYGLDRRVPNYLSNAIVLESLGIIDSRAVLPLNVLTREGSRKTVTLESAEWTLHFGWAWDKKNVPTDNPKCTIYDGRQSVLPLYLSRYFVSPEDKYWFQFVPEDRLLYSQLNQVFDKEEESLLVFTQRFLKTYQDHTSEIDRVVIDLRFNEGGNESLVNGIVREFEKMGDRIGKGKLFIITGRNTFSAACAFIGKMLKATPAVTVGDIAGPLNSCADPIGFILPHSQVLLNVSRAFFQDGAPWDTRGCYFPDYYVPVLSKDTFAVFDPVLHLVRTKNLRSLKDILFHDGVEKFREEWDKREGSSGSAKKWFPYSSYDLAVFAYEVLIPAGKLEETTELIKLITKMYPDEIWGWFLAGMLYSNTGNLQQSLECLNRALAIEPCYAELLWERDGVKARTEPFHLDRSVLEQYPGAYGEIRISREEGRLIFQDGNGPKRTLAPISETYFYIENQENRIVFCRKNGAFESIKLVKSNGRSVIYKKE
jgi:tetratricopeptide (TPR) repeat protein